MIPHPIDGNSTLEVGSYCPQVKGMDKMHTQTLEVRTIDTHFDDNDKPTGKLVVTCAEAAAERWTGDSLRFTTGSNLFQVGDTVTLTIEKAG